MPTLDNLRDAAGTKLDWPPIEHRHLAGGVEDLIFGLIFDGAEQIPTRVVGVVDNEGHKDVVFMALTTVTPYGSPSRRRWRAVFVETRREGR